MLTELFIFQFHTFEGLLLYQLTFTNNYKYFNENGKQIILAQFSTRYFFLQDNYLSNIIDLKFKLRYDIYM